MSSFVKKCDLRRPIGYRGSKVGDRRCKREQKRNRKRNRISPIALYGPSKRRNRNKLTETIALEKIHETVHL